MTDDTISVIKIHDVLMVTLPTDPDDYVISQFQQKMLETLERYQSKGLVLDISLVETLDSFFARTIVETSQMVGLMGGRMVVAGMRPSVAITATQLGLSLGSAATALDVDQALNMLESDTSGNALR